MHQRVAYYGSQDQCPKSLRAPKIPETPNNSKNSYNSCFACHIALSGLKPFQIVKGVLVKYIDPVEPSRKL
jgi:hypothetical protein